MFMPIQPFGRRGVLANPARALVLLFLLFDAVIFFLGETSMQRGVLACVNIETCLPDWRSVGEIEGRA